MLMSPDHYRREAELFEQAARYVSLNCDKASLLADAEALRRLAELAARSDGGPDIVEPAASAANARGFRR